MQVQLEKTQHGLTLTIPAELAAQSKMDQSVYVDLSLIDDKILVAPVRKSKYNIDDLLAGITDENIHPEVDFGPPVGKELL